MPRFLLILFAVPAGLLLVALLLIPLLLDEQQLLDMATKIVKEETGATLTVGGEAHLSLFPKLSVDLSDTAITMPDEEQPLLKARFLGLGLELIPLLSGAIQVGELSVDGLVMTVQSDPEEPAIDKVKLSDAELDAVYAKRRQEREEQAKATGDDAVPAAAAPLVLNIRHLLVTDSVLEIVSAESGDRSRVEIINLEATDVNLDDRSIPLTMKARLEGGDDSSPVEVSVAAQLRVNTATQQLRIESIALEVSGALADTISLQSEGVVDLRKQVADLQLEVALGETRGEGKLRFANLESPKIDATLHLNVFDPVLLALAGPDAGAAASAQSTAENDGGEGDAPLPLNAIRALDTRAVLTIDRASFAGHNIEKVQAELRAVEGVVKLKTLTGVVHGGTLAMKATFNGKHNVGKLSARGKLTAMDIAVALDAMESEPVADGLANLEWQLKSSGTTSNELIEAMKGPIKVHTSNVNLKNLGIEKMLCEAVALANGESLQNTLSASTHFEALTMDLAMSDGKLKMKPLRAELLNVKLKGDGDMDLLQQSFSATFSASLSPGLEELDPACRVNERLTSIDWPVDCEGDITGDPAQWCQVDSQSIIEDLAAGEVKRKVGKEASRLLDKLFK
jgi:AsmA protein